MGRLVPLCSGVEIVSVSRLGVHRYDDHITLHTLEFAQPIQKTAPCDHVVNILREGKRLANVRDRLLEKFPLRPWLVHGRSAVGRRRNHETVDEGGVEIVDLDYLVSSSSSSQRMQVAPLRSVQF